MAKAGEIFANVSHLEQRRCWVDVVRLHARDDQDSESRDGVAGPPGFERFFREHYPAVVRLAQTVVGDFQAAQDVAQEAFLAAYRRFPEDYEQAAGWVRVAALHTAINVVRGDQRRVRRHLLVRGADFSPSAEEAVIGREARAELRRALDRLPRRSAAVLVMRHAGMSYLEIAAALGVKVGHVGTLLRRAESALRKEMDRETRK
jgi:RNA polymerase sigma factor (sigma-70 family)